MNTRFFLPTLWRRLTSLPQGTNPFGLALLVALCLAAARLAYVTWGPLDLSPDEAQYWDWSRRLDWGYYSKPPLVAWLNWLSTSLLGHTEFAIRSLAVLGQGAMALTAFWVANRHYGATAGWLAFATFSLTPEFAAGGLIMTTDIPCTLFWLLALAVLSTVDWNSKAPQWRAFLAVGVLVGLAGLGKYTAALFYPLLGFYLLFYKECRPWLWRPQIYVAGTLSALFTAPVVYWNYTQNFVSFKHVLFHQVQGGMKAGSSALAGWDSIGNFLLGQVAVVGPITFFMLLGFWVLQRKTHKVADLFWWFSAPAFALFFVKALGAKVQANWPVLAVAAGLVGLCCWLSTKRPVWRVVFCVGLVFSAALSASVHNSNFLRHLGYHLPPKADPLNPVLAWEQLGRELGELATKNQPNVAPNTPWFTTRYQTASVLSFYLPGQPHVNYVNPGWRRQNQYDLWPWPNLDQGILYVNEQDRLEPLVAEGFKTCEKLGVAEGHFSFKGTPQPYHQGHLWHCTGHTGLQRPRPEHY